MASYCGGGKLCMKPVKTKDNVYEEEYPYSVPTVYLEGTFETYFPQMVFDWNNDSVVVARDNSVIIYTLADYNELLAKDEDGNVIWMDGRTAPYSGCWNGEYLNEQRYAYEFIINEYDLQKFERKKYKMVLDETSKIDDNEYKYLKNLLDADSLDRQTFVKDGVLKTCFDIDKDITIPDTVTEIPCSAFEEDEYGKRKSFNSISIPKTVVKIDHSLPKYCETKEIHVSEDNPRYYTKNGCLIDRKTKTLVWGYSGNTIPDDGSVEKIGPYAFHGRNDIKSMEIPDIIKDVEPTSFDSNTKINRELVFDDSLF